MATPIKPAGSALVEASDSSTAELFNKLAEAWLAASPGENLLDVFLAARPAPPAIQPLADLKQPFQANIAEQYIVLVGTSASYEVLDVCRTLIAAVPQFGMSVPYLGWQIASLFRVWQNHFKRRFESPWLAAELLSAIPGNKRVLAQHMVWVLSDYCRGDRAEAGRMLTSSALQAAIELKKPPHRRLFAETLLREAPPPVPTVCFWLLDPALRVAAEPFIRRNIKDAAPSLEKLLPSAKPAAKNTIVKLLRTLDPNLTRAGARASDTLEEMEVKLRTNPEDIEASSVWADALIDRGDPRGEVMALTLSILQAPSNEEALARSGRLAKVCKDNWPKLVNKPGGFPFNEKWRGRAIVHFGSEWNHRGRAGPGPMFDRFMAFTATLTDALGPIRASVDTSLRFADNKGGSPLRDDELSPRLVALARALGDGRWAKGKDGTCFEREPSPLADVDELRRLVVADPNVSLLFRFKFKKPKSTALLPFQEPHHYAGHESTDSSAAVCFSTRDLALGFLFPFEGFSDPGFLELYDAITETLGNILTPSGFAILSPTADGKSLKAKQQRFAK